ncbi:hypothetical protein BACPEC_02935 [[Bacteroides] pectinophilus ATCC 43243]|uniref:Uncharacterized protein n=1 Tax=[Bacteroides] pectinophilus ATCC 43243 TaxID=483218 RepID=B7AW35_9FIRM|nr:hypothetical protein BACPEC_02935 [[Bacteroides] pectinophilus ATCC 43243]
MNLVNEDLRVKRINAQKAHNTDDINSRRSSRQTTRPSKRDFEDDDDSTQI